MFCDFLSVFSEHTKVSDSGVSLFQLTCFVAVTNIPKTSILNLIYLASIHCDLMFIWHKPLKSHYIMTMQSCIYFLTKQYKTKRNQIKGGRKVKCSDVTNHHAHSWGRQVWVGVLWQRSDEHWSGLTIPVELKRLIGRFAGPPWVRLHWQRAGGQRPRNRTRWKWLKCCTKLYMLAASLSHRHNNRMWVTIQEHKLHMTPL